MRNLISRIYRRFKYKIMMFKEARRQQKAAREHYFKIEEVFLFVEGGEWKCKKAWEGITRATYLIRPNLLITIDGNYITINRDKIKKLLNDRF